MVLGALKRDISSLIELADTAYCSMQRLAQILRASWTGFEQRLRTPILRHRQIQGFVSLVRLLHSAKRQWADAMGVSFRPANQTQITSQQEQENIR